MKVLRRKFILLIGYLEYMIKYYYSKDKVDIRKFIVSIIILFRIEERGC